MATTSVTCGVSVSMSVELLLPGAGSVTPAGAVTVAVLASVPVAFDATLATTVYVTAPPTGKSIVSLMLPLPLAVKPAAPPLPAAVKVALAIPAGSTSATLAPVTSLGPLLVTTTV